MTKKIFVTFLIPLFSIIFVHNAYASASTSHALISHNPILPFADDQNNSSVSVASKFVRSAQLYKSLSLLLLDSVKKDKIVEVAISHHGFAEVKKSVVLNIKEVTNLYRTKWDAVLADIYANQFNAEILQSIMEEGENSPHFSQFVAKQKNSKTDETLMTSAVFKEARTDLVKMLQSKFPTQFSDATVGIQ